MQLSEAAQFEVWIAEERPPLIVDTFFFGGGLIIVFPRADDWQISKLELCLLKINMSPKKGTVSKGNLPTIDF